MIINIKALNCIYNTFKKKLFAGFLPSFDVIFIIIYILMDSPQPSLFKSLKPSRLYDVLTCLLKDSGIICL